MERMQAEVQLFFKVKAEKFEKLRKIEILEFCYKPTNGSDFLWQIWK